jgi:RimJ/RimL family protein N-acetyltransferase
MRAPILRGEKVILKPFALNQAENYVRWFRDKEVDKYLGSDHSGLTLRKEREFIKQSRRKKNAMRWAIYTKDGAHIGSAGLHEIDLEKNLKAVWGICIGEKNYWNQGLGADTLKTVLRFSFNKLKLNRIELGVFPHNPRGRRCYAKCGFKAEGVKRQSIRKNGKFIDEIIMGMVKDDYKKRIGGKK